MNATEVKAIYWAAKVADRQAPYDSIAVKLYHPCGSMASFQEQQQCLRPYDPRHWSIRKSD